jgi:Ras-related protein Rab-33B
MNETSDQTKNNNSNKENEQTKTTTNVTKQHKRIFKIIVIGDSNVGKTCLTFRFCGGRFLNRSEATIGVDFREKSVEIDSEVIKLQIWDTGNIK